MEINIDLSKVGYVIGKYDTRATIYFTSAQVCYSGYSNVKKFATNHRIDSSNVEIVKNNLLESALNIFS